MESEQVLPRFHGLAGCRLQNCSERLGHRLRPANPTIPGSVALTHGGAAEVRMQFDRLRRGLWRHSREPWCLPDIAPPAAAKELVPAQCLASLRRNSPMQCQLL